MSRSQLSPKIVADELTDFPTEATSAGEGAAAPPRRRRGMIVAVLAAATIAAVLVATLAIVVVNRRASSATVPIQHAAALTATSTTPRHLTWEVALEASGTITAWQEASIGAQIGGYQLSDVLVNVGDQVKKGQVLARLDPNLLRADEAELAGIAGRHNASIQQIALAWLLSLSPVALAIPGTGSIAHLEENVAAGSITLTEADLAELV